MIQVAGVRDRREAEMLLREGVDMLGFPFALEYHSEDLPLHRAAELIHDLRIGGRCVLITYLQSADEILRLASELGCGWVQLHGDTSLAELIRLRKLAPQLKVIRSLVLGQPGSDPYTLATETAPWVHAFLTDSYDPETRARGATGKTHDWRLSRDLVLGCGRPLLLAGGLHAGNVSPAIRFVRPAGVDAHTGLEDESGAKDPPRVRSFVRRARAELRACATGRLCL